MIDVNKKLTFQMQPTHNSCASACLAMILDIPVEQVMLEYHELHHSRRMYMDEYLETKGLEIKLHSYKESIPGTGLYMLTVPSLNIVGGGHSIIAHIYDDGRGHYHDILDPNRGREGKRYYVSYFDKVDDPLAVKLGFYQVDFQVIK